MCNQNCLCRFLCEEQDVGDGDPNSVPSRSSHRMGFWNLCVNPDSDEKTRCNQTFENEAGPGLRNFEGGSIRQLTVVACTKYPFLWGLGAYTWIEPWLTMV